MAQLHKHAFIHDVSTHYFCDLCPYKSVSVKGFISHKRRHVKERTQACSECGKAFFTITHLRVDLVVLI